MSMSSALTNEFNRSSDTFRMLIGGELVSSSKSLDIVNPATEKVAATIPVATVEQLDAAVDAARRAFSTWKITDIGERRAMLQQLAEVIEENAEELAQLLTLEQGKTIADARNEVLFTGLFLQNMKEHDFDPEVLLEDDAQRVEIHRRPLGVVAGIVPWNFPLLVAVYKITPALIAGNCIIVKPAPTTPLATLKLGEFAREVFPPGVMNIVADSNDLGPYITAHTGIDKISFTGSTATGKKIMASGADTLKRMTLELGGNDAAIVLDDVDVGAVVDGLFGASFMNSGQVCICLKRLYVHEAIYDEVCSGLAELAKNSVVGNGLDDGVQFGPVQNRMQYEKVCSYIEDAKENGEIIAGGDISDEPGYFVPLTVVRNISDGTRLVDEEPFGPILPVIKYSDVDDAIDRANRSEYGLGASVWSADVERARAVAAQLDSGTVWINKHLDFGPHIPFPPSKNSGIGVEWGREGLLEYTAMKVVNIAKA